MEQSILNSPEFEQWFSSTYHKKINEVSVGELREALSFYYHTASKNKLVNKIVKAIKHNTNLDWSQSDLSIDDQAVLVKLLREGGYSLDLIDYFPQNTTELKSKLSRCRPMYWHEKLHIKIKSFLNILPERQEYVYGPLIIFGLVYFANLQLFLYSILITWILWAILEFPKHDYFEHGYVIPKNKFAGHLVDFVLYFVYPTLYADRLNWINVHVRHHKFWRQEQDTFFHVVNEFKEILRHIFKCHFFKKPNGTDLLKMQNEHKSCSYIFKYIPEIRICLFILFIALFGFEYFFYLFLIPLISKIIFDGQHDWYMSKFGERDYWFLFPIALNQSWHLYHHENYLTIPRTWDDIFLGPKWVKYINPQYYVARLLFKFR